MNNRYTFKAKRKDNGEWYFGCLSAYYQGGLTEITGDFGTKEVIKETLCQCTGLQDIEGNYIFENDIVELNNIEFRVDYSYGSFEFSHDADIDKNCDDADYINPIDYKVDNCKIIGNKFDKEVE